MVIETNNQEFNMRTLQTDLSIYKKFNFERPPLGIKYLLQKPEGIEPVGKCLPFCEMFKEAHQTGRPFYFTKDDEDCFGKGALGMASDPTPFGESGLIGYKMGIFQEPRANSKLNRNNYQLPEGIVNYVVLSPVDQLTFEPDLLLITADPTQAEILMRAMTYSSGEIYESKATPVLACSWICIYPFITGKVNYVVSHMVYCLRVRQVFPQSQVLISIPYNWIPTVTQNLHELTWEPPEFTMDRERFIQRREQVLGEVVKDFENP
jgi:uncharacterized protein (DUF169 family)